MPVERRLQVLERLVEVMERNIIAAEADSASRELSRSDKLGHVKAMTTRLENAIMGRKFDQADEALGFVKGALWALNVRSLDEIAKISRAD
jgi:hypothetical protein